MSSQASLLNLSPRLLVVSCRYTTTALPVRRLDVSFTRSSKNLTFDGQYRGKSTACNARGSASFSFKSSPGRTEISRGSTFLPFFTCSHMRLFSMVDFPMPWEPLTTKKEGALKVLPWGELMKSLMCSSSSGRAGAGSFLFSLCPASPTSHSKEPLNERLENQHYDAPCAQQRPTSFNGLRRKSPCGLCSCMTAWKDKSAWHKLNLPHKDASAECRRKGTIHPFSQFVPNWLWYWRMLDMQNQTGTTAPNLNQYMNLKQIIRHLWTTAW